MGSPASTGPTYDSEMGQPVHRPGMERAVNRGNAESPPADPRDQSGNRMGARRQVGEADPATREHMIDEADEGSTPPPAAKAAPPAPDTEAGSGIGGREREDAIMDTVAKDQ